MPIPTLERDLVVCPPFPRPRVRHPTYNLQPTTFLDGCLNPACPFARDVANPRQSLRSKIQRS
eukprot:scaffold1933_cov145-Skeletonema_dohrnii-CCMP3373.AAC.12